MLELDSPIFLTEKLDGVLLRVARAYGWQCEHDLQAQGTQERDRNVALIEVIAAQDLPAIRHRYPHALLLSFDEGAAEEIDLRLPFSDDESVLRQVLQHAQSYWRKNKKVLELVKDVAMRRQRMHQLNEISLALTGEMPQQELLKTILSEARRIAGCEGGSLFIIEQNTDDSKSLVFKLAENDVVEFPFVESRLPLTSESISGCVAVTGRELNIEDVYRIAEDAPYQFNRSFDDMRGYRTQSMLTLPMRDHREQVVGVLQFINATNQDDGVVVPFGEEIAEVLRAIASQAAVSLQKNSLVEDINQLFESFVQASVKTIEQRDPATSGHSFRVADTTVALLQALPSSGLAEFSNLCLTPEHIREVRYAALLHDFGKIGVPEAILVKANKLSDERLEILRYRFELQKERLRRQAIEQELDLLHHQPMDQEVARRRVHRRLEKQISILDQYYQWLEGANNPNLISQGDFQHLEEIRSYAFNELDGSCSGIITEQDLQALSVRRGSLTEDERRQIEAHVVFTTEFLEVLPWPPELAGIPEIAGAHHERMDGSGYPRGLVGEKIPLASRVMAVCDVFDALTAMDRPYKPSMSDDRAFEILNDEADRGLLDQDLVNIFIASGSHQRTALTQTG